MIGLKKKDVVMATKLLSSSKFNCSSDVSDDFKYICGLSTILVATIQEVKDHVSQIEFIFCSQLFPNFQSKSKLLQTMLADAKRAADEEWRKKEADLLNQIEELLIEKKHFKEQIQQLNNSLEENKINLVSNEHLANKIETEKKQLLEKLECLMGNEEIVKELKKQLEEKSNEVAQGKELLQRLLKQIELKDQSMLAEQRKRRDLVEDFNTLKTNYKQLKSQYNFLLGKIGNTRVNMYCLERAGEARNMPRPHLNKRSLQDSDESDEQDIQPVSKQRELKIRALSHEKLEPDEDAGSAKVVTIDSRTNLSSSSIDLPPKHMHGKPKFEPLTGLKRADSCWRDTRGRQEPGALDPHDDFLDTPMEVLRNLNQRPQEAQALPVPPPQDMDFNNSDEETQDLNIAAVPKQPSISILGPANKSFKYVEPVRKKAERENLKGIECKQCRKFYDAVLPTGEGEDNGANTTGVRCEHHDGVSRHRYRYAPPMTPEGFWNIDNLVLLLEQLKEQGYIHFDFKELMDEYKLQR
ncbi:Protein gamma response 1, partial [Ananas comosus]